MPKPAREMQGIITGTVYCVININIGRNIRLSGGAIGLVLFSEYELIFGNL